MGRKLNEQVAVVATIDPDAYGTGTQGSDYVDMADFEKVMWIVQAGALGSSATLDFALYEATDDQGDGEQAISGKAITQLTEAGTDSDKQAIVEVRADELSEGYRYVRGILTIGTATSDAAAIAVAGEARYQPASDYDLASVDEIV